MLAAGRLHPAADLHGPGFATGDFAKVEFKKINQQDCDEKTEHEQMRFECRKRQREEGKYTGGQRERSTKRRKMEIRSAPLKGFADDRGFEETDTQKNDPYQNQRSVGRFKKTFGEEAACSAGKYKKDSSAILRFVAQMLGGSVVVVFNAGYSTADAHKADDDGHHFNKTMELKHEQDTDEQFGENHDDLREVAIQGFSHACYLLFK